MLQRYKKNRTSASFFLTKCATFLIKCYWGTFSVPSFKTASIFLSGIFENTDLAMLAHLEYLSLPWEPPSVGLRRPCVFCKKEKKEPSLVPSSFFAERVGFASEIYFRVSFTLINAAVDSSSKFLNFILLTFLRQYCALFVLFAANAITDG